MRWNKKEVIEWLGENYAVIAFTTISAIIAILVIAAIYQGAIQPREGIVVRKDYSAPYTTTEYTTINQGNGNITRIPMQKYHEARYEIVIRGTNRKGQESYGYYNVTPAEYEKINLGDYYVYQIE